MPQANTLPAWNALSEHYQTIKDVHMRSLFAEDPDRFKTFSRSVEGILCDFSKNRIRSDTFDLLLQLAEQAGVKTMTEAMFSGEKINTTEDRAVLHVALRNRSNTPIMVDGQDVMPEVNAELDKMRMFR